MKPLKIDDKRKQSLYFKQAILEQLQAEAARLDRSLSWVVQRCVKESLPTIQRLPAIPEVDVD